MAAPADGGLAFVSTELAVVWVSARLPLPLGCARESDISSARSHPCCDVLREPCVPRYPPTCLLRPPRQCLARAARLDGGWHARLHGDARLQCLASRPRRDTMRRRATAWSLGGDQCPSSTPPPADRGALVRVRGIFDRWHEVGQILPAGHARAPHRRGLRGRRKALVSEAHGHAEVTGGRGDPSVYPITTSPSACIALSATRWLSGLAAPTLARGQEGGESAYMLPFWRTGSSRSSSSSCCCHPSFGTPGSGALCTASSGHSAGWGRPARWHAPRAPRSLKKKDFFANFTAIIVFALLGTLVSAVVFGLGT